jgi:formylmethanofuran dehydrogenase subunit E
MKFNDFPPSKKPQEKWNIVQAEAFLQHGIFFKVYCSRCGEMVLAYRDSAKMKPKEVEHCGEKDTFYIGEEVSAT